MSNQLNKVKVLRKRWLVYFFMYWTAAISLAFQRQYTIHELIGLLFVPFVIIHVAQRWVQFKGLLFQLSKLKKVFTAVYRKAVNDTLLVFLTAGMLISGLWDWRIGHPTKIRWHAIFGVLLAIDLLVHAFRRRHKIRL